MEALEVRQVRAQQALKKLKRKVPQHEIAEMAGISHGAVKNFSWKRVITEDDFVSLEKWLTDRGYLDDTSTVAQEEPRKYGGFNVSKVVVCPECRQDTPQDFDGKMALVCLHCGAHIFLECPNPKCGYYNALHTDFCIRCNMPLTDVAVKAEAEAARVTGHALMTPIQRLRKREKEAKKRGDPTF